MLFAYANTKPQNSCGVTVQLISVFVFCYIDSKIPLFPKSEISSHWPCSVSDLVGKPEDRFSRDAAIISQHIQVLNLHYGFVFLELQIKQNVFQEYENHLLCA